MSVAAASSSHYSSDTSSSTSLSNKYLNKTMASANQNSSSMSSSNGSGRTYEQQSSSKTYQVQTMNGASSYYASSASAANSTGGASSVLSDTGVFYEHKVDERSLQSKIDQLELLNTVGTGTFGRVIVVRHKTSGDYYALKIMSIAEVLRLKQTEHVKNEKDILTQVNHAFIINL